MAKTKVHAMSFSGLFYCGANKQNYPNSEFTYITIGDRGGLGRITCLKCLEEIRKRTRARAGELCEIDRVLTTKILRTKKEKKKQKVKS